MVLYFIGLGLGDEKDITVKGLETVKRCKRVFLESYTAILGVNKQRLEDFYGCKIIEADRYTVESSAESILEGAEIDEIAFLVVGDPLAATTHTDLFLRAAEKGIQVIIIHNASIMNSVGCCGLQLYNFGQTVSIPFFSETWRPTSFYEKIRQNLQNQFHTLCLLDIKVKEPDLETFSTTSRTLGGSQEQKFLPPRFMTVKQCLEQLLEAEEKYKDGILTSDKNVIGLARVGHSNQQIISGTIADLLKIDFGPPLHSVVIPAEMHIIEREMFEYWHWNRENRKELRQKEKEQEEFDRKKKNEENLQKKTKQKRNKRKIFSK